MEKLDLLREVTEDDLKLLMKTEEGQCQVIKHINFLEEKIAQLKQDLDGSKELYDQIHSHLKRIRDDHQTN